MSWYIGRGGRWRAFVLVFVRELVELYLEPHPHFNTVSTQVRILEGNGFLKHEAFGNSFRYESAISEKEYGRQSLAGVIKNYLDDSYLSAVSAFVKEKKISVDEKERHSRG